MIPVPKTKMPTCALDVQTQPFLTELSGSGIGFRISRDAEVEGIDLNEHSETAYEFDTQSSTGGIPSGQLTGAHARHAATNEGDRE